MRGLKFYLFVAVVFAGGVCSVYSYESFICDLCKKQSTSVKCLYVSGGVKKICCQSCIKQIMDTLKK